MALGVSLLEDRYIDCCSKRQVEPNASVLLSFSKVKNQKMCQKQCVMEIFVDEVVYSDFPPLIDALSATDLSAIDAIDVRYGSSGLWFDGEDILSLLNTVNHKLRVVDLSCWSSWKELLSDICHRGLACQALYFQSSPIRKLDITGIFSQLKTLNLDFSCSLTSLHISSFRCMPKLMHLSMCGTRITNLWMTCAAIAKLPSLVELRFQNCLCCFGTGPCPTTCMGLTTSASEKAPLGQLDLESSMELPSLETENFSHPYLRQYNTEKAVNPSFDDDSLASFDLLQSTKEESPDASDLDLSGDNQSIANLVDTEDDASTELNCQISSQILVRSSQHPISVSGFPAESKPYNFLDEGMLSGEKLKQDISRTDGLECPSSLNSHETLAKVGSLLNQRDKLHSSSYIKEQDVHSSISLSMTDRKRTCSFSPRKYIAHHISPLCFEKHYREYMVCSLPCLKVLDNLSIKNVEREKSKSIFRKHYEYLPYNRQHKDSVVNVLQKRELGSSIPHTKSSKPNQHYHRESCYSISRSLSSAKVSSSSCPILKSVSKYRSAGQEIMASHPRQFEYHPTNPSLLVFGTLEGELVLINHESTQLVGYLPSAGALHSILGLCWLKKYPTKLLAGSDNGSLQLFDICKMPSTVVDRHRCIDAAEQKFDKFEQLTSLHVNSTDELFIASGFSKHLALYDIGSGRRLQIVQDLHQEHINVVRFSHHSPTVFATASFDKKVKMWDLRQGTFQPCYTASSSRGNVMVCFSLDDHYIVTSAVDNEVKQLLAVDGRLHTAFDIASTGSALNYTRSYYMNGRDYVISGSSEENIVRVCCAQTGRRLRDISFECRRSRNSMFIRSLRGDPFRDFHMSVLAAYGGPHTKSEIIKVNMLSSGDCI